MAVPRLPIPTGIPKELSEVLLLLNLMGRIALRTEVLLGTEIQGLHPEPFKREQEEVQHRLTVNQTMLRSLLTTGQAPTRVHPAPIPEAVVL